MSDWISVTNTPKRKDQAEEADQQAPLSKAQQKNKKRAEKRRERVEVLKGLAWNEDDEALAAAAQHELLQRTAGTPGASRAARRRSNSSGNLADEDDDDEAPPVAEVEVDVAELHKKLRKATKASRRADDAAAKVAAGNADKDLVAKAGRRAALEADEKAARRAVEDADAKRAARDAARRAELSLLSRRRAETGAKMLAVAFDDSGLREHLRSCGPDAHMYPPRRKFGHVFKQPAFVDKKKDARQR
ncbi:hypothetical protein JL720_1287 [Aureococcus anophagefferens]|nr:hypothetical protein JL720_1287 [Aureococcus anophagefferens]